MQLGRIHIKGPLIIRHTILESNIEGFSGDWCSNYLEAMKIEFLQL
jgi:hypothetical protein